MPCRTDPPFTPEEERYCEKRRGNGINIINEHNQGRVEELRKETNTLKKSESFLSASLCAVMSVITPELIDKIDFKEAGITKEQLTNWFKDHNREDTIRQYIEAFTSSGITKKDLIRWVKKQEDYSK